MSSIALALKYRPASFSDLVGQNAISQTLSLALDSKHISHAYLFSGLRGSGKTSSARIFARALECESGPISTPCGSCASCVAALENRHIDIIEMDAASSRGIDDIKKLIEQTKYRPSFGRYKIFIIDEVHMLSKEAFNALLKTLEEPPEFVKFILATTDPLKLPATILSRTQHFRFKQIPHRLVVEHITNILNKEGVSYEQEALEMIARSGSGSLRDTLTLLDQAIIFCKNHIEVASVSDMLGIVDPQVLKEYFQGILHHQHDKVSGILQVLYEYECEMILDEMMLFLKEKLLQRDSDFPPLLLDRFARILTESKSLLNLNTDGAFVLLLCAMKMQEAIKVKDIETMIEELENEIFGANQNKVLNSTSALSSLPSSPQNPQAPQTPADSQNPQAFESPQAPAQTPSLDSQKTLGALHFQTLIQKITDRNAELGEIFEKNVKFVEFSREKSLLRWQSVAQGEHKEKLREFGKIIVSLVREIFGANTHIEQVQDNIQDSNSQATQDSQSPQNLQNPQAQSPQNQQEGLQKFTSQNRDVIEAIRDSVGIKEVLVQNDKQDKGDENA
ncbi:DNA polymerase III subunits gamma and tau [Helicobacter cinaedi PAGU611]|uniref:DNA polymerase III subunit gamma/tau n=1 Tax=Helicobacter cinaedi CCUG 18818 = ATCC BAA-847 TaxID=537971 RepID=A0AAI8MKR0_9HELI|nr:DNA polymerase III subunit gamma/tau [Helicobacter cinaedi]QOQ90463.1 DNA polymerase III subunit gamma/tau [Helicobacter cinaedi]BAM11434.1 DNA polymerase III subunits gamma and tau [Helicobacter cinaedi PAGU611]BAM31356.1 DNA polymerase III subunits gamma and tau [Helicobacter cinaedi CCUG 18818 = ATCC BAA-847]BBB18935.1 DNA polymerase III subunits gamma and tau [Helicobacter cinaedi]